ncbi:alkaline phosphatase family protein, partial [Thermotoga sp.]|uniref:alkaline phosphatase family protein n=1 Tax=Thermotoga sp. TaxID=28240 RepID=UPI0025F533A8
GFLAYILHLREVGSLVNMIELSPLGFPRDSVLRIHSFRFTTIFQMLQRKVRSFFLVPRYLLGTGFSRLMSQGAEQVGFSSFGDMIEKSLEILEQQETILVFIYWPSLDSIAHKMGIGKAYFRELRWLYKILKSELIERLRSDTLFFMVSDHGQISTPSEKEVVWNSSSEVMRFLDRPPAGEQRMMYLYTKRKKALVEYLVGKYADFAIFIDSRKATRLFGTGRNHPEFIHRIGDVILIAKENFSFNYRYTGKEESLAGRHGSLTHQELVVPLVVYRR